MKLHTPRLELIAATLEHIQAELRTPNGLSALLGAPLPDGWPPGQLDRDALEYFRGKLEEGGASAVGWYAWYALTRSEDVPAALVAGAGYFGPPQDGRVEVGFSVVPGARGRGYASECAAALIARAFEDPSVAEVVAHTSDANLASRGVLRRSGFVRVRADPDASSVLYRLARPAP